MWPFGEGQPLGSRTYVAKRKPAPRSTKTAEPESRDERPKMQARYRGYTIYKTPEGEFFSSLDRDSWYERLLDVKRSIDDYKKGRGNPAKSEAYEAGRRALASAAARYGTVNLTPSIAQREEWRHAWGDFMKGWNAEKRRGNPAKFDRCVKAVKKRGGAYDPYAVCTAAGTQNPSRLVVYDGEVWQVVRILTRGPYAGQLVLRSVRGDSEAIVPRHSVTPYTGNPSAFEQCVSDVEARGGARDPRAVCAAAGRKKYGQREMTRRSLAGKRKAAKRNPATAAAEGFEEFHGYPPDEIVTVEKRVHFHKHLSGAGKLKALVVKGVDHQTHTIKGFGPALLAFNEAKDQLFVEGGDQSLDLREFGIEKPHELETIGKVLAIDYFTNKTHLGEDGGRATYAHQFRTTNENGQHVVVTIARYPDLIYRRLDEQLEFSGGSYTIRAEGIDL